MEQKASLAAVELDVGEDRRCPTAARPAQWPTARRGECSAICAWRKRTFGAVTGAEVVWDEHSLSLTSPLP